MGFLVWWTNSALFSKVIVNLCLAQPNNIVAVIANLIAPSRQILFNFKCKPLDNGI